MREMVFDIVNSSAKIVGGKCLGEELGKFLPPAAIPETAEHEVHSGRVHGNICELAQPVSAVVLVDRNMLYIGEVQPGFTQAVGDGLQGKSGPMLDPRKALFFRRSHQHAVPHQGG